MNRRSQPHWSVSGVVEAPVEKVWEVLLESNPILSTADKAAITRQNGSQPFTTSIGKAGEGRTHIEVDKQHHSVALQSEWWYRGVHSVESHERGSLLVYRVYNIAPGIGWWAAQLVQGPQNARGMKDQLQELLKAIGARLACAVYLMG